MTVNRMSKNSLATTTKFRNFRAGNVEVTGGNLSEDANYFYRTFRSSGTLTVTGGSLLTDVLVIAGGGGGGVGSGGGGGGAGGIVYLAAQSMSANRYTVTVGGGGAAATVTLGSQGGNSSINGFTTAVGGGYGSGYNGGSGGSGGGGGGVGAGNVGGAGTAGQGSSGGNGNATSQSGGGGGGATVAGGPGIIGSAGAGGGGTVAYSSWASVTGTGANGYYAGGGGGGAHPSWVAGLGGLGGGGNGAATSNAVAGVAGTGSGGGGGAGNTAYPAASGGSGLVIVRYAKTSITSTFADFEHIGTIELTAPQSSVVFSNIPSGYKHLQLRISAQGTSANDSADLYFNEDTSSSYSWHALYSTGGSPNTDYAINRSAGIPECPALLGSSYGTFSLATIDILDIANQNKFKTVRFINGRCDGGGGQYIGLGSGLWRNYPPVLSLKLMGRTYNMNTGSRFSLYGIRG